jgi:hypothetical protein
LLLTCGNAAAQGQPIGNGIYACDGAAQAGPCQPEGDDDSSYSSGDGYTDNDYAHAEPKWADRWGAIADADNRVYGIVSMMNNESEARVAALNECTKRGGMGCAVVATYYNQCAAVSAGDGGSEVWQAPTEELAIKNSMTRCDSARENCRVYYSGCSLPERIQ